MFRFAFAVAAALVAGSAVAAAPRISFERIVPAPHDLRGAEDLAIVYAISDNDRIRTFLDVLLDETNRSGLIRIHDATGTRRTAFVDAHLRVTLFTCTTQERAGDGNAYDVDGKRIRRRHRYADASCTASVEVLNASDGVTFDSFRVRGEGTSPRVDRVTFEEEGVALDQAARLAAVAAAEQITPRRVRETIVLADEAPEFSGGLSMVESGRLQAARRMWEGALKRHRSSAALRHNLAAVCEALGDVPAASNYYAEAQRLAPTESRHRIELEMFRRRNDIRVEEVATKKKRR